MRVMGIVTVFNLFERLIKLGKPAPIRKEWITAATMLSLRTG